MVVVSPHAWGSNNIHTIQYNVQYRIFDNIIIKKVEWIPTMAIAEQK